MKANLQIMTKLMKVIDKRNIIRCADHQVIVALEGTDGSGKTTLISDICSELDDDVLVYKRTDKGPRLDKILSGRLMNKLTWFQVPIYFCLSYKNYIKLRKKASYKIIIMERCFLSNICYFYPKAMYNSCLLKIALFPEVKLVPQKVFVLDIDPLTGQKRDKYKKSLDWLIRTRKNYLDSANSLLLSEYHIQVLCDNMVGKKEIIVSYIKEALDTSNSKGTVAL